MDRIIEFDQWLISDIFEPLAWRCEERYEKDACFLARICSLLFCVILLGSSTVFALMLEVQLTPQLHITIHVDNMVLVCILVWVTIIMDASTLRDSREFTMHPRAMDPEKAAWWKRILAGVGMISVITFTPLGLLFRIVLFVAVCAFLCGLYFSACDKKPPGWMSRSKQVPQTA